MPLRRLIVTGPSLVHSVSSAVKSNRPRPFSDDHIRIEQYGSEWICSFVPVMPCASLTINRLLVKMAVSRKVL